MDVENVEEEETSRAEHLLAQRRFKVLDGEWTSEELGRFFWLAPEDMLQVKTCRGAANRLGFALNLLLMRLPHCPFPETGQIPPRIVQFVAMQFNVHPEALAEYAVRRPQTRDEHLVQIRTHLKPARTRTPRTSLGLRSISSRAPCSAMIRRSCSKKRRSGCDLLVGIFRRTDRKEQAHHITHGKALTQHVHTLRKIAKVVLDPAVPDEQVRPQIFAVVPQTQLQDVYDDLGAKARPEDGQSFDLLLKHYTFLRQFLPDLLRALEFTGTSAAKPVVQAIAELKRMDAEGKRTLPAHAPLDFLSTDWRTAVEAACASKNSKERRTAKHLWELGLADQMRKLLRSSDLSVPGQSPAQGLDLVSPLGDCLGRAQKQLVCPPFCTPGRQCLSRCPGRALPDDLAERAGRVGRQRLCRDRHEEW